MSPWARKLVVLSNIIDQKISPPTLKKPVLSYSAAHTSYVSNLTQTFISSQLENEDSTAIQQEGHLKYIPRL